MFDFEEIEKELNVKFKNLESKIVYLYYTEKYSIRKIVRELKCSQKTISKVLHSNFGVRNRSEALELRSTDEYKKKLSVTQLGERNNSAKLTTVDVLEIRESYPNMLGTFTKTQAQYILAEQYGVKRPTISDIVLFRTWKHI